MGRVHFTVVVNDKEYKGIRDIEGKRVFRQVITVAGHESQKDDNDYGNNAKHTPVNLMEHFAKVIARKLINSNLKD